jgi:protein involved in polysaccharide export with SLBB domain
MHEVELIQLKRIRGSAMKARNVRAVFYTALAFSMICSCLLTGLAAQEILLRIGDKLDLTVPQRQELDRNLEIDEKGEIFIPIVGNIKLSGTTLEEAQIVILSKLRDVYPSVASITLTLVGEESRRVIYVHGEVLNPGKLEFEGILTVWDAIREAGGATPAAALELVRIIHAEGEGDRTTIVNMQQAIDTGDFSSLPQLRPGDTVIVPQRSLTYQGSGAVRVLGAVTAPITYSITGTKTLRDAIIAAGGPAENANLAKVKIIRLAPEGTVVTYQVNFKRFLEQGDTRHNPIILPDDTINVPGRSTSWMALRDPRFWVTFVASVASLTAIVVALQ